MLAAATEFGWTELLSIFPFSLEKALVRESYSLSLDFQFYHLGGKNNSNKMTAVR